MTDNEEETHFYSNCRLYVAAVTAALVFWWNLLPVKMVYGQCFPWAVLSCERENQENSCKQSSKGCDNRDLEPQLPLSGQLGNEGDGFRRLRCLRLCRLYNKSALPSASAARTATTLQPGLCCSRGWTAGEGWQRRELTSRAPEKNVRRTRPRSQPIRTPCWRRKSITETKEPFTAGKQSHKHTHKKAYL